jgi:RNA polymerase sigma-70 factor (ECF subfamily)
VTVTRHHPDGDDVATGASDAELLEALAHDRNAALGALYDRHARLVYGLALAMLTNRDEAEDLTQEVFLALCTRRDYDPARGTLSAYLIVMTRSRALDRLRARGSGRRFLGRWERSQVLSSSPFTPPEELALRQESGRVRGALAELSPAQRQVLELAYFKDLTQPEIATELDLPLGTVKTHARRGLQAMRRLLEDLLP